MGERPERIAAESAVAVWKGTRTKSKPSSPTTSRAGAGSPQLAPTYGAACLLSTVPCFEFHVANSAPSLVSLKLNPGCGAPRPLLRHLFYSGAGRRAHHLPCPARHEISRANRALLRLHPRASSGRLKRTARAPSLSSVPCSLLSSTAHHFLISARSPSTISR